MALPPACSETDIRRAGGELTIDLGAIADNWRLMRRRAGTAECAAVVKANAYGLGLERVAPVLWDAGARTFFVALPQEGADLRTLLPDATIHVLNGLFASAVETFISCNLCPILGSREEIEEWIKAGGTARNQTGPALHVDTGINRLGFSLPELQLLAEDTQCLEALRPSLLMSHMACADQPDHPLNAVQLARFAEARRVLPQVPGSLANSAATLTGGEALHDLVRPGVCLYGGHPIVSLTDEVQDVVTLMARVVQVREVQAGATVSYGASQTLTRDSRIATLSIGYADGLHRIVGSSDEASGHICSLGGQPAPIVGRVTMDLIMIDVTDISADIARRGAWVEVIGPQAPLLDMAAAARTIDYEILTSLGRRFARRYVNAPGGPGT